ncbi:MAG: aldehyde dehydrogenase family protein [Candidatus Thermoplasmatota archaeon]|nr:aldehyde dehydrogenase family protein [Candidatus Thermoplasmatota archaeon]
MPMHNTKLRKMVKDVHHDTVAAIDKQISRATDWKSVGPRERRKVVAALQRIKDAAMEEKDDLLSYFLPTK